MEIGSNAAGRWSTTSALRHDSASIGAGVLRMVPEWTGRDGRVGLAQQSLGLF
jgi:hypothetical protein